MHRNNLLSLLKNYKENNLEESETVCKFINFVERNPNCFDRELKEGHITGSCWLLNKSADKALLTHHKKLNLWLQLGGHADGDSNILSVAIKEAQEESGIMDIVPLSTEIFDLDVHLFDSKKEPAHLHYDVRFLLKVNSDDDYTVSEESLDLAWMSYEKLNKMDLEPAVKKLNKKWHEYSRNL